jgi:hypothetical protein
MTKTQRLITTEAGFGPPIKRGFLEKKTIKFKGAYQKSRGVLVNPDFLKLVPKLATGWVRPSPLAKEGPVMFVATHHKSMTTYFSAVLKLLGMGLGIPYEIIHLEEPAEETRLFLSAHGKMDLAHLRPYRGVHIVRDPRDMIVSGYHYHKWTAEDWVHRPDDTGRSYQQKLLAANQEDGLFMEINHFIFFYRDLLEQWNMDDPDLFEVSYESLMGPERNQLYNQIFTHLGFEGEEHAFAIRLMHLFEAKNRKSKKAGEVAQESHVRSGKSGQWKDILTTDHIQYIEEELGPVLRKFGY